MFKLRFSLRRPGFFCFVTALICLGSSPAGLGAAPADLGLGPDQPLHPYLAVLEDPQGLLSPEMALAPERAGRYRSGFAHPPGLGTTHSTFWIRFQLNNSSRFARWFLVLKLPRLETGILYRVVNGRPVPAGAVGLDLPFSGNSFPHRDMVFRLQLAEGETGEYLLKIHNRIGPLVLPFQVVEEVTFLTQDQIENVLIGLYFGILLIMGVYNLSLFFLLRDRAFLFYAIFALSFGVLMGVSRGLYRPFLGQVPIPIEIQAVPLLAHFTIFLAFVFLGHFFRSESGRDRIDRFIRACVIGLGAHLVFAVVLLTLGFTGYPRISFVLAVSLLWIPNIVVAMLRLRQGYSAGIYFLLGWAFLAAGGISSLLVSRGLIPHNGFTYNGVLLASVLEITLLSLGLSDRFRRVERDAERHRLASETKTRFLAHMSHEIRTPLNAVLGMTELLAESKLSGEQAKYLTVLNRAGRNLLEVINNILDISKIEAGHLQLESIRFKPTTLVESLQGLFTAEAHSRGVELIARVEGDIPEYVRGDPTRLRQVLSNLISNAIKFTERGFVRVLVRADREAFARPGWLRLEFEVSDSGIGIDLDKWERIFDSFSQADESTTRRYGGTGLGLAICRSLVELMGGRIGVESFPGKGSRFYFAINFDTTETGEKMEKNEPVAPQESVAGRGLALLLAEDNPDNRLLFLAFLKRTTHRIDVAVDGAEAVRLFQEKPYDMVFMDVQMPVLSGLEAVRVIREWEKDEIASGQRRGPTPIYALTAHALEHERRASLDAGCDGHLSKPLEKKTLLAVLESHQVEQDPERS